MSSEPPCSPEDNCDVEEVYGEAKEEALFAWNGYSAIAPAAKK